MGAQPRVTGALEEEAGILGLSDDSGCGVGWEAFKRGCRQRRYMEFCPRKREAVPGGGGRLGQGVRAGRDTDRCVTGIPRPGGHLRVPQDFQPLAPSHGWSGWVWQSLPARSPSLQGPAQALAGMTPGVGGVSGA